MAKLSQDASEVNARIVYWGVAGAGKTTSIQAISDRLRSDHRGKLRQMPTGIDPTASYDLLPIELGSVAGVRTRIQIVGVPGGPDQAPTRKQLLDEVDGIVLVVDSQPDRLQENVDSLEELRGALTDYGRAVGDIPLVVQYNKRDLADPYALEELHRRFDVRGAAAFESVATEGSAVLQALTTVSKQVIRLLREQPAEAAATVEPAASFATAAPVPEIPSEEPPGSEAPAEAVVVREDEVVVREDEVVVREDEVGIPEEPIPAAEPLPEAAQAAHKLDGTLAIASVGNPEILDERRLRIPVVLCDDQGRRIRLGLTVSLDPPDDEDAP